MISIKISNYRKCFLVLILLFICRLTLFAGGSRESNALDETSISWTHRNGNFISNQSLIKWDHPSSTDYRNYGVLIFEDNDLDGNFNGFEDPFAMSLDGDLYDLPTAYVIGVSPDLAEDLSKVQLVLKNPLAEGQDRLIYFTNQIENQLDLSIISSFSNNHQYTFKIINYKKSVSYNKVSQSDHAYVASWTYFTLSQSYTMDSQAPVAPVILKDPENSYYLNGSKVYYTPPTDESMPMLNLSIPIDSESGISRKFLLDANESILEENCLQIPVSSGDHLFYCYDKVGNLSDSLGFSIYPDNAPPAVIQDTQGLFFSMDGDKVVVNCPYRVTDNSSGIRDLYFKVTNNQGIAIYQWEMTYEEFLQNQNGTIVKELPYRGTDYYISIRARDNLGLESNNSLKVTVPYPVYIDNGFQTNAYQWQTRSGSTLQDSFSIDLTYKSEGFYLNNSGSPINPFSLVNSFKAEIAGMAANSLVNTAVITDNITRVSENGSTIFNYKQQNIIFVLPENFDKYHQDLEVSLWVTPKTGSAYEQQNKCKNETIKLPALPNRTPEQSMVRRLNFNSPGKPCSIENQKILYTRGLITNSLTEKLPAFNFSDRWYFNSLSSLELTPFVDSDGDNISSELHQIGQEYYLLIKESYRNTNHRYLLPIELVLDETAPIVNTISLDGSYEDTLQLQHQPIEIETLITELNPIYELNYRLKGSDGRVIASYRDRLETQSLPANVSVLQWQDHLPPFSQIADGNYTLEIICTDSAGNQSEPLTQNLRVDRQAPPLPNGDSDIIRIDSPELQVRYSASLTETAQSAIIDTMTLTLSPQYSENPECFPSDIISFDLEPLRADRNIESLETTPAGQGLIIQLSSTAPPNYKIPIKISVSDLAGNRAEKIYEVYTPAEFSPGELNIEGSNSSQLEYHENSQKNHTIQFSLKNPGLIECHGLKIFRNQQALENWNFSESSSYEDSGEPGASGLTPHENYQYSFIPVNLSGFYYDPQGFDLDITPGNYLPLAEWIYESPVITHSISYLGPAKQNRLDFRMADPDGDSLTARIELSGGDSGEQSWKSLYTFSASPLPEEYFPGSYSLLQGENPCQDGEDYQLRLQVQDSYMEEDILKKGPPVLSKESIHFRYDSSPPRILIPSTETLVSSDRDPQSWISAENSAGWGDRGLEVQTSDEGVGTASIIAELYPPDSLEGEPLFRLENPRVLEDEYYRFDFEEGHYLLKLICRDKLWNQTTLLLGDIYNDHSKPEIVSAELSRKTPGNKVVDQLVFSSLQLKVNLLEWVDTYSSLQSGEYRYLNRGETASQRAFQLNSESNETLSFNCYPLYSEIEQGEIYTLQIRVCDQGGNFSEWYSLADNLKFDLTGPEIEIDSEAWGFSFYQGALLTSRPVIALPPVQSKDNESAITPMEYFLLEKSKSPGDIDSSDWEDFRQTESIRFPSDGSYSLLMQCSNEAGLVTRKSMDIIYDSRAPEDFGVQWISEKSPSYYSGDTLLFQLSGRDNLSGIDHYRCQLMKGSQLLLEKEIPAHRADRISLKIPAMDITETLRLYGAAVDGAGNIGKMEKIDQFQASPSLFPMTINTPAGLGIGQDLSVSWEYDGPETINYYRLSLYGHKGSEKRLLISSEIENAHWRIKASELSPFEDVNALTVQIHPIIAGGIPLSQYGESRRIWMDRERPVIKLTVPPILSPSCMPIHWEINDNNALETPELSIYGQREGERTLIKEIHPIKEEDLRSASMDLAEYLSGEELSEWNLIQIRMQVKDFAGNRGESCCSSISIDRSSSSDFEIMDQGLYLNPLKNDLTFHWLWAENDPESGNCGYLYQLVRDRPVARDLWQDTRERTVTFQGSSFSEEEYPDGTELFLLIKERTLTGESIIRQSNGIQLDRSAPVILGLELRDLSGKLIQSCRQATGNSRIMIKVDAYDNESNISYYQARPGILQEDNFIDFGLEDSSDSSPINASVPLAAADSLFLYQVTAYNALGEASLPSESIPLIYAPSAPVASDLTLDRDNRQLKINWKSYSSLPLTEQRLDLYKIGESSPVASWSLTAGERFVEYDRNLLSDGDYQAELSLLDSAGNRSATLCSTLYRLDTHAASLSSSKVDSYIYDNLNYQVQWDQAVTEIALSLISRGTTLWQDKRDLSSGVMSYSETLDLTHIPRWSQWPEEQKDPIILQLEFRDQQGNWSAPWYSDEIIFDGTAPQIISLNRDNRLYLGSTLLEAAEIALTGNAACLDKITLKAEDKESAISSYRWGIFMDQPWGDQEPQWLGEYNLPRKSFAPLLEDLVLEGLNLADKQLFYLAMEVSNQSGIYSAPSYSGPYRVDLSPPAFSLIPVNSLKQEGAVLIFGDQALIDLEIEDESCHQLEQRVSLKNGKGDLLYHEISQLDRRTLENQEISLELPRDQQEVLSLEVILEDCLGHSNSRRLSIRRNAAPQWSIPQDLTMRPGDTFSLPYQDWVSDGEPIVQLHLTGTTMAESLNRSWGETLELTLCQFPAGASETQYNFTIEAQDSLGTWGSANLQIKVQNSPYGSLITDETWSGTHYLTGEVIVPPGRTLTLLENTRVLARSGPIYGERPALIVEAGGQLIAAEGVVFRSDGLYRNSFWQGILLRESVDLTHITISGALRGLTLAEGVRATISQGIFRGNKIGLHLLTNQSTIQGCQFIDNLYYGIKEEQNSDPLLLENFFENNGFDYYDSEQSVLSADSLIEGDK